MNGLFKLFAGRPSLQIALAVILFLSITVLGDRFLRSVRLDLTADNLYTLSDGTSAMLRDMDEQVSLTFYFSKTLAAPFPQFLSYGKRVEDLLTAFADENPEAVSLSIIDPLSFSEEEDQAVEAGLRGIPLSDGSTLYMGLTATNSVDGEVIIPFFAEEREKFLEYDLVKLVSSLDGSDKRKLGLLTRLPMQFGLGGAQAMLAGQAEPYVLYEQLWEFFEVIELADDFTEIPTDLDVLMVAHPPSLGEEQLFLLDQYALSGGKILAFVDPHSEAMDPRAAVPSSSSLDPLLSAWGVNIPADKVVADASLAQRVQMGGFGPDSVKDYPFWISITNQFLSADDIVTGAVNSVNIASPGVIELVEGATTTVTPLITSSAASALFDVERAVGVPDPDSINRDLQPAGEMFVLSARIEGPAKTAYPDKVAELAAASTENAGFSEGTINVVVTADTDLFDDRFWVQIQDMFGQRITVPLAGNGSFIMNLADHISGSEALLSLRGRGISKRPFDKVDELRREAERKYLAEEEELQNRLTETEARIASLEGQNADANAVLSPEQEAEIDAFRTELLETRRALRDVKRRLRQDIDSLGGWLTFINTALMPMFVVLYVLGRLVMRRRREIRRFL